MEKQTQNYIKVKQIKKAWYLDRRDIEYFTDILKLIFHNQKCAPTETIDVRRAKQAKL